MKKTIISILVITLSFAMGVYFQANKAKWLDKNMAVNQPDIKKIIQKEQHMKLGAFSVSLSVKDIEASIQFYENLGFTVFAGDKKKNYVIMKNEQTLIGFFQGMFENNILTFNPGLDKNAHNMKSNSFWYYIS